MVAPVNITGRDTKNKPFFILSGYTSKMLVKNVIFPNAIITNEVRKMDFEGVVFMLILIKTHF
jgi:hypothetical protein